MIFMILAGLVSFSGLFFGHLLTKITPEEIKPGRKYFVLLEKALFVAAVLPIAYAGFFQLWIVLGVIAAGMILFLLHFRGRVIAVYAFLIILLALASADKNIFLVESALVFVYGLAAGTLLIK